MTTMSVAADATTKTGGSPAAVLAPSDKSAVACERVLCLLALPEVAAGACCALVPFVSDAGWASISDAIVLLLSRDVLAGCWMTIR